MAAKVEKGWDDPQLLSKVAAYIQGESKVTDAAIASAIGASLDDVRLAMEMLDATGDVHLDTPDQGDWVATAVR